MICESYCSHGGVCELDPGHEGLHDSSFCQWADAEALTKEAADQKLLDKGPEGEVIVTLFDLALAMDQLADHDDQV